MAFRARGKEIINSIASVSTAKLPLYKKLWENPNPTSAFAAQPITLLNNDYDFLLCIYRRYSTDNPESVVISEKGTDFDIEANYATSVGARVHTRSASIQNSGLTISWGDALVATGTTASSTNNNGCVPVAIYGFKKEVDIQSVIASVSTEASKCMLSDGVTDVETELDKKVEGWTFAGNVTSTSLVTVTVPATAKEILAVLANPSNVILISQVIPKALMSSGASLKDVANTSKELYFNGSKWKVTDSTYTGKIYYR